MKEVYKLEDGKYLGVRVIRVNSIPYLDDEINKIQTYLKNQRKLLDEICQIEKTILH